VQEAEDGPLGDEGRELVLVVAAARDDDGKVRELLVDLVDERLGVMVRERGVDEQHRVAGGDHEVRRVRHVVGAPDTVCAGDGFAQQVDQRRVRREHDDVRALRTPGGLRQRRVRARRPGGRRGRRSRLRIGARRVRIGRIRRVVARQDVRVVDVHWALVTRAKVRRHGHRVPMTDRGVHP